LAQKIYLATFIRKEERIVSGYGGLLVSSNGEGMMVMKGWGRGKGGGHSGAGKVNGVECPHSLTITVMSVLSRHEKALYGFRRLQY